MVVKKVVTDPKKVVGLDMSLSDFYVDNEGNSPGCTRNTRKCEMQLAKAQRSLSRKKKGSKNWKKAKRSVALKHDFNDKLVLPIPVSNRFVA